MAKRKHPFADLIGFIIERVEKGFSLCTLILNENHYNPYNTVHGGVLYTVADTGMGAALSPFLENNQSCATIELTITYFKPVVKGTIECKSVLINKGKTVASLESEILNDGKLVAKAYGSFSIFKVNRGFQKKNLDL